MKSAELRTGMDGFFGTEEYHRFSILFPKTVLTDGAKWLADNGECYWLMDIIGSIEEIIADEPFTVVQLTIQNKAQVPNPKAVVKVDDGNGNVLYTQLIEYTDFPLNNVKLYANRGENNLRVVMLTSEY